MLPIAAATCSMPTAATMIGQLLPASASAQYRRLLRACSTPKTSIERNSPRRTMSTPPSTTPIRLPAVNMAFTTSPISVLLNPTSIMNGVNSLLEKASPTLNSTTTAISASALGVPRSSFSGSTTDSVRLRGW